MIAKVETKTKKILATIVLLALIAAVLLVIFTKRHVHPLNIPGQLVVENLQAPTPMNALGQSYLVYELYLTNYQHDPITLTSLEINGPGENEQKFKFTNQELGNLIHPVGKKYPEPNPLLFQPGTAKIVFLWLPFTAQSDIPSQLIHKITFNVLHQKSDEKKNETLSVTTDPLIIKPIDPVIISAPVKGDNWVAGGAPSNTSFHRGAHMVINGHNYFAQRYAIDFVQIGPDGKSYHDDANKNKNYYAYGKDVLAVLPGKITEVIDGLPENIPQSGKTAVPIDLDTVGGNHVVIDIGNGKYAFYAHLIPGKIKVNVGDTVTSGQVIGQIGNSGNSTEPHLHFHIVDSAAFLAANGIPYAFDSFDVRPSKVLKQDPIQVQILNNQLQHYANQLMLENTVIKFGE